MMKIWPSRCVSLVKNELKFAGPFGLAALLCGTVFVDRLNQEKALQTMKNTAKTIIERNVSFFCTYIFFFVEELECCFYLH